MELLLYSGGDPESTPLAVVDAGALAQHGGLPVVTGNGALLLDGVSAVDGLCTGYRGRPIGRLLSGLVVRPGDVLVAW